MVAPAESCGLSTAHFSTGSLPSLVIGSGFRPLSCTIWLARQKLRSTFGDSLVPRRTGLGRCRRMVNKSRCPAWFSMPGTAAADADCPIGKM